MIRYFFIAVLILPLMAFSQQQRTIIIPQDDYGSSHRQPFQKVFKYLAWPFHFADKIFHKQRSFVNRLHDKITFNSDRHTSLIYQLPVIINDERRIILNNKSVIILPQRKFFINDDRNGIIIKRNGRTIYINRDRRS